MQRTKWKKKTLKYCFKTLKKKMKLNEDTYNFPGLKSTYFKALNSSLPTIQYNHNQNPK